MSFRILVTHGRSRISYVVAKSLNRAGFEIFVSDSSRTNMTRASRVIRGFDRIPYPHREAANYVESLAEIIMRRKIDILLPGHEDVFSIQQHASRLPVGVLVAAPPYAALCAAGDKLQIIRIAESVGVRVPQTVEVPNLVGLEAAASQLTFPMIVKVRRGNGGKGVHLVHTMADLVAQYRALIEQQERELEGLPILQEYIADGALLGACFLAKDGVVKACFTERYLRCKQEAFGTSVLRERYDWPLLTEAATQVARALRWTGIGHLDFIANASMTEAYLLEMNPRWWGALNLAVANGFDFPRGLVTMLLTGEPAADAFQAVYPPRRSLWILGEMMACRSEMMQGKFHAPLSSLKRVLGAGRDCVYDDFEWHDPLPLSAEFANYMARFLRRETKELGVGH